GEDWLFHAEPDRVRRGCGCAFRQGEIGGRQDRRRAPGNGLWRTTVWSRGSRRSPLALFPARSGRESGGMGRHDSSIRAAEPGSLVVIRRLLQLRVVCEIVLNPKLRASVLQERLDGRSRGACLLRIKFERRYAIQHTLLRVVIEIAGKYNGSGLRQFQI